MARSRTLTESLRGLKRLCGHFWPAIRKHRALIAGSSLALVAEIGLRLLEPWPLKFIFDRVLLASRPGRGPSLPALEAAHPMTLLAWAAVAVLVITGLRALAEYCHTVGFSLVSTRVLTEMRNELYRHLQRLSLSFHSSARSGDLTVRVIADVNLLKDVTVTAVRPLLGGGLVLVGMLGVMFALHWRLALVALAPAPLFCIVAVRLSRRIRQAARKQRQRQGAMAATAAESMGAIKVVQALSLEQTFAEAFVNRSQGDQQAEIQGSRLGAQLGRTTDALLAGSTALVLWFGAQLVLRQALSPGDLLVFLTYLKSAFRPVREFAKYTGRLAKASAAGERVLEVLERTPDVRDLPGAVPAPAFRGAVHFDRVSFAYEPGRPVLERIDFTVCAGQHVALVGPSGIGKSTLVSLVLRLYDPIEGRVLIDGRDIREYKLESLRSHMSVVLQESILFASSVRDNLAYARPGATLEEIRAAARLAHADEFIAALPQGYDTVLGERGVTLSAGQRQRLAIARAALRQAPILILDEPTTGLDEANARAVTVALERLARGRTTFLITHDLELAARADMIVYLDGDRVVEHGTPTELLRAGGRYAALYRMQAATWDVPVQGVVVMES